MKKAFFVLAVATLSMGASTAYDPTVFAPDLISGGDVTLERAKVTEEEFELALFDFQENNTATTFTVLMTAAFSFSDSLEPHEVVKKIIKPLAPFVAKSSNFMHIWTQKVLFQKFSSKAGLAVALLLKADLFKDAVEVLDGIVRTPATQEWLTNRIITVALATMVMVILFDPDWAYDTIRLLARSEYKLIEKTGSWGSTLHLLTDLARGPYEDEDLPDFLIKPIYYFARELVRYVDAHCVKLFEERDGFDRTAREYALVWKDFCQDKKPNSAYLLGSIERLLK